jgi:hypothetical protein
VLRPLFISHLFSFPPSLSLSFSRYELEAFRESVAEGKGEAGVTLEDGILSVALGAAAHRSILTGEVTTVRSHSFTRLYWQRRRRRD